MKKITAILIMLAMLLSLTACGAQEAAPSAAEQAYEDACALLAEGKYEEAIEAFTSLESYRRIQEKIDEAAAALEAQKLAEEQAAHEAHLANISHLLGKWKSEDGTIELTFQEDMLCHYREWIEVDMTREIDYPYTLAEDAAYLESMPVANQEEKTDLGFAITIEERDGVTYLTVGGIAFLRAEE